MVIFSSSRTKLVVSRSMRGSLVEPSLDFGSGSRTAKALRPVAYGAKISSESLRSCRYADGGMSRSSIAT